MLCVVPNSYYTWKSVVVKIDRTFVRVAGSRQCVMNCREQSALQIRSRRKQLGLSIGALAEKSGIDAGSISRIENGITVTTLSAGIELSRALSIELPELVKTDCFAAPQIREELSQTQVLLTCPKKLLRLWSICTARM